jgi:hypothetical protein
MLKRTIAITIPIIVLLACSNEVAENKPAVDVAEEKPTEISLASLVENTSEYVGREVSVTGTVDHVCKHGGKRMFIIDENPEHRFKITAGEAVGAFDISLEGSDVQVRGLVQEQKVDEGYLDNWETELSEKAESDAEHESDSNGEDEDHHKSTQNQIQTLRHQLAESEDGCLSFYSLECQSFETVE